MWNVCVMSQRKRTRQDRYNDFKAFKDSAQSIFDTLKNADQNAQNLERIYKFYIDPPITLKDFDSNRRVEVFFGNRPFEICKKTDGFSVVSEEGSHLIFNRGDDGYATIIFSPVTSRNRKPIEDEIIYRKAIDPIKLTEHPFFFNAVWANFIAYTECTRLDSEPNLIQKVRIMNLHLLNLWVIDNVITERYILKLLRKFFEIGMPIFLGLTPIFFNHQRELSAEVKNISEQVNKISEAVTNIVNEIPYNEKF